MRSIFSNRSELELDFEVRSLAGLARFSEVHELQKNLLQKRIADEIPDTLLFCEHHPVITRGRGLQYAPGRMEKSLPILNVPEGTDYVEIERGGDLTWHGPGQLVFYPIVKLGGTGSIGKKVGQDIDRWVRFQEQAWMNVLDRFEIKSHSKPGGSGVWITHDGIERKIVSVGIALKKWVNYHGTAGNILNDLAPFYRFDPCGFRGEVMIRARDFPQIPSDFFGPNWRSYWEKEIVRSVNLLIAS